MTRYEWDAFFSFLGHGQDSTSCGTSSTKLILVTTRGSPSLSERGGVPYFDRVDEIVGRLVELAGPGAIVCVASDHGFGPAHKYCSFNIWLLQEGFLKLKRDALTRIKRTMFNLGLTPELAFKLIKKLPLGALRPSRGVSNQPGAANLLSKLFLSFNDVDWNRTVAFSKGSYGQIYINLKGREPDGAVQESEYDSVCEPSGEAERVKTGAGSRGPKRYFAARITWTESLGAPTAFLPEHALPGRRQSRVPSTSHGRCVWHFRLSSHAGVR